MRVNVDERAFMDPRFFMVTQLTKMSLNLVLGTMLFVWHASQSRLKTSCTRTEFLVWSRMRSDRASKLFDALVTAEYLVNNGDGTYEISGNDKHVQKLEQLRQNAAKGGAASKKSKLWTQPVVHKPEYMDNTAVQQSEQNQPPGQANEGPITNTITNTNTITTGATNVAPRKTELSKADQGEELDAIYALFPKRGAGANMGRSTGMKTARAKFKTKKALAKLRAAVEAYAEEKRDQPPGQEKFNMQWSTFVRGKFEDYLNTTEPYTGPPPNPGEEIRNGQRFQDGELILTTPDGREYVTRNGQRIPTIAQFKKDQENGLT